MTSMATRAPEGLSLILWTRPIDLIHLIVPDPPGGVLARTSENACGAHGATPFISAPGTQAQHYALSDFLVETHFDPW